MTRMGKAVPESRPTTAPSAASALKKTTGTGTAAGNTSAMKKVYCTPKITFVGEKLFLYIREQVHDIQMLL